MELSQPISKEQIYALLRNDNTLKYIIKDIVQNENFWESYWRKMLEDSQLKDKINYIVGNKMNDVSREMRENVSAAKRELTDLKEQARRDISTEFLLRLPDNVAVEIRKQMPSFLNDNRDMQNILEEHIKKLCKELEEVARQHLEKIVDEEQYHQINSTYFEAFDRKGQEAINSYTYKVDQQIQTCRTQTNQLHEELTRKYNNDMGGLRAGLNELQTMNQNLKNLRTDITRLSKENKQVEDQLLNLKITLGIGSIIAAIGYFSFVYK